MHFVFRLLLYSLSNFSKICWVASSFFGYTANCLLVFVAVLMALDMQSIAILHGRTSLELLREAEEGRRKYYAIFGLCVLLSYVFLGVRTFFNRNVFAGVHMLLLAFLAWTASFVNYQSVRVLRGHLRTQNNDETTKVGLRKMLRTALFSFLFGIALAINFVTNVIDHEREYYLNALEFSGRSVQYGVVLYVCFRFAGVLTILWTYKLLPCKKRCDTGNRISAAAAFVVVRSSGGTVVHPRPPSYDPRTFIPP
jgi:hypothetical protein